MKRGMTDHVSSAKGKSTLVDQPRFVSAAEIAVKAITMVQVMPEISDEELLEMAIKFEKEHPQ